jgi:hypothetical protein
MLVRDKHSSLLETFISYAKKCCEYAHSFFFKKMRQTLFSSVVVILLASVPAQVVIKEQPKDGVEVMNRDPNRGNEVRRHVILLQSHFADLPLCQPEQKMLSISAPRNST